MKHKFLTRLNVLLGTLSLTIAGCHTPKNTTTNQVVAIYGVRVEDCQHLQDTTTKGDTIQPLPADTLHTNIPQRPPQIMPKYGIPIPRDNQ